jgi:hypothetical protein
VAASATAVDWVLLIGPASTISRIGSRWYQPGPPAGQVVSSSGVPGTPRRAAPRPKGSQSHGSSIVSVSLYGLPPAPGSGVPVIFPPSYFVSRAWTAGSGR